GTLAFAGLTDTGSANTPAITQDNTFDLSLSGQESGTSVVYEVSLNGGAFTSTTRSQSDLADGTYQFRAFVPSSADSSANPDALSSFPTRRSSDLGTLAFAGLTDTGSANTPAITQDNTFDLSLSGQEAGTSVVYEVSLNGGAFT